MPRWPEAGHALGAALLAGLLAAPAGSPARAGQALEGQIEGVEQALEQKRTKEAELADEATRIRGQIEDLRADLVAAAAAAQGREQAIADLEARLDALSGEAAAKAARLASRRTDLVHTLAALQTLSRRPVEALIAQPVSLTETMRTSLLLGAVVPALEAEAARLRGELAGLARLRAEIAEESTRLAAEAGALDTDRARIAALITRKDSLYAQTEAARRQTEAEVGALAEEASDLHDLLRRLEAQARARAPEVVDLARSAPKRAGTTTEAGGEKAPDETRQAAAESGIAGPLDLRSVSAARGKLVFPVNGRVVTRYNETSSAGVASRGITIAARPDALVTAPFDGVVVFAGPFRGYGLLLIIEHSEGYHSLLAGLGRIDSALGQWVLAGEPVGVMGPKPDGVARLYVEFRRNGQPVNPLPWLAAADRKVSG